MLLITQISFAHFGSKGPFGGTVTCGIAYDTLVYIGTAEGGVYQSTNSAITSWSPKPVGLKSGKINSIAHSGRYIFVATADSGVFRFTGFVGSDRYWEKTNTGLTNLKIKSLIAIDSITVLAGTDGGGLFKTTNKGASWAAISSVSLNNAVVTAMAKAGSRIFLSTLAGGIFKSDDHGDSWQSFNDVNTMNIGGSATLSYNASSDELMVLNSNGLFLAAAASTANTAVFNSVGAPLNADVRSISNNGTKWFLATNKGVYASVTGTISFATFNTSLSVLDVNVVVPFQSKLVAGSNRGGIFKSTNGTSWTAANNGFNNLGTSALFTNGTALVIAATEKGVHVSNDLAASYKILNKGLTDSLNVTDLTLFGTKLLASTKYGGVFVSADTAKNWVAFNADLGSLSIKKIIPSASFAYLITTTNEIYRSDLVNGWSLVQTGLPVNVNPTSLAFYEDKIILGTYGNGVYTKNETSGDWTSFGTGLSNANVTAVAALVKASGTKLFAGTDGSGVFVADATSGTWTATVAVSIAHTVTMGLNGKKIQTLATYGGYVFASYKGGLLATKDAGKTWIAGGNQFNLPSYTNVNKISFVTTRVFVVTDNNGLYSNALSELDPVANIEHSTNVKCHGECNASATVVAVAGGGAYTYLWSDSQTTATATNLCPGKYFVTVTSSAKTSVDSVLIAEPNNIVINASGTPSSGSNGSASTLVSGGTPSYTYLWSNSETTASISGLASGDYTVTVTDGKGCAADTLVKVNSSNGTQSLEKDALSVYPNPCSGKVFVDLSAFTETVQSISVYDYTGKLLQNILAKSGTHQIELNGNRDSGFYFITLNTATTSVTTKVIVE